MNLNSDFFELLLEFSSSLAALAGELSKSAMFLVGSLQASENFGQSPLMSTGRETHVCNLRARTVTTCFASWVKVCINVKLEVLTGKQMITV